VLLLNFDNRVGYISIVPLIEHVKKVLFKMIGEQQKIKELEGI
jgi:hypothetical protein